MARARNIKPGIMENEELADCDYADRLLFIYLWMLADREGRLEDRPRRISAKALPYDDLDVSQALTRLAQAGFLQRYTANGVAVIQIVNFDKHQKPHQRESASELPPPQDADFEERKTRDTPRHTQGTTKANPSRADSHDCLIADSHDPGLSDCLIADSHDSGQRSSDDDRVGPSPPADDDGPEQANGSRKARDYPSGFEQAWSHYPQRHGNNPKRAAWQAWQARKRCGESEQQLTDAARHYAQHCWAEGKTGTEYVMQGRTFFGPNQPYSQFVDGPPRPPAPRSHNERAADQAIRELGEELSDESY